MTKPLIFLSIALALMNLTHSFSFNANKFGLRSCTTLAALRRVAAGSSAPVTKPGVDIPEEIKRQNSIYDMILVERCNAPETTSVGLFIPQVEGQDRKHLALVLSVPQTYGLESEQGRVQPIAVSFASFSLKVNRVYMPLNQCPHLLLLGYSSF